MNVSPPKTPRLFIAATRQNDGKTTTSLGLLTHLRRRFSSMAFMKPVGQRYLTLESGINVDKDVWLLRQTFGFNDEPTCMSPITVPSGFTKAYIDNRNIQPLEEKILRSFDTLARDREFVLLEGTGHAGVGSVFDLSNARVAQMLKSSVVLVSGGGIGKPCDEILLNYALFKNHDVPVAGVIINKVLPEKLEEIKDYVSRVLRWHDLDVLGVVPYVPLLSQPTMREVCKEVKGEFIAGDDRSATLFSDVVFVSHFSSELARNVAPRTLVAAVGDQSDLLIACAGEEPEMQPLHENTAGILLVDGIMPKAHIISMLQHNGIPVILSELSAFAATSRVARLIAKIQPDNPEKITEIDRLFADYVDIDRMLEMSCV